MRKKIYLLILLTFPNCAYAMGGEIYYLIGGLFSLISYLITIAMFVSLFKKEYEDSDFLIKHSLILIVCAILINLWLLLLLLPPMLQYAYFKKSK